MKEPRNPFRLRASEHIESDATFVRLFGPGILDLFQDGESVWNKVQIVRSAPGGGKTSLLRLFTPTALHTLHAYRDSDECRELYQKMESLGALGESGPTLLGVMLSCARTYSTLADMSLDQARKDRLLFTLLDARMILATLRGALALKKLAYPADLNQLEVVAPPNVNLSQELRFPCSGKELYDWATRQENIVCKALDSFVTPLLENLSGQDNLASLELFRPDSIRYSGHPIAERILFMLDDVQKLTNRQRTLLLEQIVDSRSPVGIWISERFQALSTDEILSPGAIEGRDYERIIPIEEYWRKNKKKFESLVLSIADRRAKSAADADVGSFSSSLQGSLDGIEWQDQLSSALGTVRARVVNLAGADSMFREWIAAREAFDGTFREKLVAWRALEILIARENRKSQRFEFAPLEAEELEDKDDSAVKAAAELFLAQEFRLPYYFGPSRLSTLASSNIQQFLSLAGDEFEEMVSAAVVKKPTDLTPDRQDAILTSAVEAVWSELPRRMHNGRDVRALLEAIGQFAHWMTYQSNAPYSPGVTGIAISMAERDQLRNPELLDKFPSFRKLAGVLASALAHNLLELELDYRCKGERWMVLNLNRLLCLKYRLPLQYGGWKERSLKQLTEWLDQGFKQPITGLS